LKAYKLPEIIEQILAKLIQAGRSTLCSRDPQFINSTWNK